MIRKRSEALYEQAKQYFPGGVNSPVRAFKSVVGTPLFIQRGSGSRIWDADDNEFIDFCCSWGPLILGHIPPVVKSAIEEAVSLGTSFGAPTAYENKLAELILSNHRFVEMLRFVSSGTEAVMSALRLARGVTGRNKLLKFEGCYHGHVDALLVKAGSGLVTFGESTSAGIPQAVASDTLVLPLGDIEALDRTLAVCGEELAAIILEPIPANNGLLLQQPAFLEHLRAQCTRYGILLIFDEVISGFRVGFEGAAAYYNIQPDIITFGKIIGGGMPVGAYAASRTLMKHISPDGGVYQAGTLSGNPVAMAAGFATLSTLIEKGFYETLEARTQQFVQHIQAHCTHKGYPVHIPHIGSMFWLAPGTTPIRRADQIDAATMQVYKRVHLEALHRGVYLAPSGYEVGFVSAAHTTDDLNFAAEQINISLDIAFEQV